MTAWVEVEDRITITQAMRILGIARTAAYRPRDRGREARAAAAEQRATEAETALAAAREQLAASEQNSRNLDTARTRAEADADSLRIMLTDLREDL